MSFRSAKTGAQVILGRKCDAPTLELTVTEYNDKHRERVKGSTGSVDERVAVFVGSITSLIDEHALLKKNNLRNKSSNPWYDGELHRKKKIVSKKS